MISQLPSSASIQFIIQMYLISRGLTCEMNLCILFKSENVEISFELSTTVTVCFVFNTLLESRAGFIFFF